MKNIIFTYRRDIKINDIDLWLDSKRIKDFCFVSHAHGDHSTRHKKIISSPPTAAFLEHRYGTSDTIELDYEEKIIIGDYSIEIFPAGHILGSSQILIEKNGTSLIYTGDFKPRSSLTAENIIIKKADYLIMESTFGLPRYVFPSRNLIIEKLLESLQKCLNKGILPVLYVYQLGKGQEITKILTDNNFKVVQYETVYKISKIYETFGVDLGDYELLDNSSLEGKVLLVPPHIRYSRKLSHLKNIRKRKYYLSGWALDEESKYRFRVDEVFPISDHADFNELVEFTSLVEPKKVYVTHGFPEFTEYLRSQNFDAETLDPNPQFSMF